MWLRGSALPLPSGAYASPRAACELALFRFVMYPNGELPGGLLEPGSPSVTISSLPTFPFDVIPMLHSLSAEMMGVTHDSHQPGFGLLFCLFLENAIQPEFCSPLIVFCNSVILNPGEALGCPEEL